MNDKLNNQEHLEKQAKVAFTNQAESLDSSTLYRLRVARELALSPQTQSGFTPAGLLPKLSKLTSLNLKWLTGAGAGLAVASVLTFIVVPNLYSSNKLSPLDDIEMLTADADLDLVRHMDFYQWLDDSALSESTL